MKWFRLHNKLLNDPAVQRLSGDHFKMYINMLCLASSEDKGGYIGTIDDVSFALRCVSSNVSSCFIALQESDLIVSQTVSDATDSETLHETFHINKWAKNQYESDSSTKRVKKFREKVKRSKGVTEAVTETPPDTEQNRADTDTDTDKTISPSAQSAKRDKIPYAEIFDLYKNSVKVLSIPIKLTDDRKKSIKKLWNSKNHEGVQSYQDLKWWGDWFTWVDNNPFCTGSNDRQWVADFDFCINIKKVEMAVEGKYNGGN